MCLVPSPALLAPGILGRAGSPLACPVPFSGPVSPRTYLRILVLLGVCHLKTVYVAHGPNPALGHLFCRQFHYTTAALLTAAAE